MSIPRLTPVVLAASVAVTLAGSSARAEDEIVKLVSASSGMCLQPINGSTSGGDAIVQEPCNGAVFQQWTVHSVSSTRSHLVNRGSGLCLDARGRAVNGTPIQQWPCNWISNENWSFGITNNLLSSAVSNTFSHCVAPPGNQAGLPMSLILRRQSDAALEPPQRMSGGPSPAKLRERPPRQARVRGRGRMVDFDLPPSNPRRWAPTGRPFAYAAGFD